MKRLAALCLTGLLSAEGMANIASWTRNTTTESVQETQKKETQKSKSTLKQENVVSVSPATIDTPIASFTPPIQTSTAPSTPKPISQPIQTISPIQNNKQNQAVNINQSELQMMGVSELEMRQMGTAISVIQNVDTKSLGSSHDLAIQIFNSLLLRHKLSPSLGQTAVWRDDYQKSVGCINSYENQKIINLANSILSQHLAVNPALSKDIAQLGRIGGSLKIKCEV